MATNKVDSIYDIKSIEAEQEKVLKGLEEISKRIAEVSKVSMTNKKQFEGAENLNQLNEAQKNYATNIEKTQAVLKENEKLLKQKIDLEAKLLAAQSEQAKSNAKIREEITKQNAANKDFVKGMMSAGDSIVRQRLQLKELQKEYYNLSKAERESEAGQLKAKEINELNDEIGKAEQSLGNFTRQVGKYEVAGKAMKQELKGILAELTAMKLEGSDLGEGAERFKELSERAGELKDTIDGAREEVAFFASDTKNLDGVINGIEGLVGAWGAVQGAMALVGSENKELEETFTKLQAVMTIIQSLQAVQNALQKESAFNMLASNIQRKMQVTLTMLEEKATKQSTATKWLNVAAQKALNLAMSLSPFGLLLVGVAALAGGYLALRMALDNKTKAQKLDSEVSKKAAENSSDELIELKASVKQIQEAKAGRGDLTKAIANYNEKFGQNGELTKEIVNSEAKFNSLIKEQIKLIIDRSKAEAYLEKSKELAKQNIEIQQNGAAWYKELWNSAKNMGNAIGVYQDNLKSANDEIQENNKLIEYSVTKYVELQNAQKIDPKEFLANQKKIIESVRELYFEINSAFITAMNEGRQSRKKAEELNWQETIIALEKRKQEEPALISFIDTLIQVKKAEHYKNLKKIDNEYYDNRKLMTLDLESKKIDLQEDSRKKEIELSQKAYETEKKNLQIKYRDEEDYADIYAKEIQIVTEKNRKDIEEINRKWDIADLNRQIEANNLKIETYNQYDDEVLTLTIDNLNKQKEIEIKQAEKTGADVVEITRKYKKKEQEIRDEFMINSADKELQTRVNANNAAMEEEMKALDKQLKKKEITVEEYDKKALEISKKYADLELNNAIVMLENQIALLPDGSEKKLELEQQLIDAKKSMYEQDRNNFIKSEKEKAEKEKEIREAAAQSFMDIMGSITEIQNAAFENKLSQIDQEQALADEQLNRDLERAGTNESYKAELQKQADKKSKEREKERRKIQLEQAKFEKNKAIFDAIIGTASEIAKNAANPPLALLAAIVGAAQLAAIVAQPLPKYAKGRKGGKEEFALVAEQGAEIVKRKSGKLDLFTSDTITKLNAGDDVLTNQETMNYLAKNDLKSTQKSSTFANNIVDLLPLQNEIKGLRSDLKRKEPVNINIMNRDEKFFNHAKQYRYGN